MFMYVYIFRAVAHVIYRNQEQHLRVRQELMEFLLANQHEHWAACFGGPRYAQLYASQRREEGTWGGSLELILAARKYGVHFILYQPHGHPRFLPSFANDVNFY
jgi:hypothetical protein